MNVAKEDYLRAIFILREGISLKEIRSADVAKKLRVSKPSVFAMTRKMVRLGFVKAAPYSKIVLTKKGESEAQRVIHSHRIIEVFLTDILGYNLTEVHAEAHKLEHAFSDQVIERLEKYLRNPRISPSGKDIPHGKTVPHLRTTLDLLHKTQSARISHIRATGSLKRRLLDMGLTRGVKVNVKGEAPPGNPIEIAVKGYSLSLRKEEARNIEVIVE